jgi:hypothetical protein
MKLFNLVCLAVSAAALSGCVVHDHHGRHRPHGAKVIVPVPAVVVPVPVVVDAKAKHCPPGQAKKGNC